MSLKIQVMVEKGTNYFFHLPAIANINWKSPFSKIFDSETLEFLDRNREVLKIAGGTKPSLYAVLNMFLPGTIDLNCINKVEKYYSFLERGTQDPKIFINTYSSALEKIERLHPGSLLFLENKLGELEDREADLLFQLADIYIKNFKVFEQEIWEREREKLFRTGEELNKFLREDFSEALSDFGLKYEASSFKISLFSLNGEGPDAIDLGYDKNLHFYGRDYFEQKYFIWHEIIIRCLKPVVATMIEKLPSENYYLLWDALESLAEFYNSKIIPGFRERMFSDLKFIDSFDELYRLKPDFSPEELLAAVLRNN